MQLGLEGGAEALAGIGGGVGGRGIPGGTGREVSLHSGRAVSPRAPHPLPHRWSPLRRVAVVKAGMAGAGQTVPW